MARAMKDSGIEWIGKIPEEWENRSIRRLLICRDGGAWGDEVRDDEEGTICLRIADFDYKRGRFRECELSELTVRKYMPNQVKKLKLEKGDILIEKSGGGEKTPVGRTVLFDKEYLALFANFMDRLRVDSTTIEPEYLQYWLQSWYACRCSPFYINQTIGIQNINLSLMIAKEKVFYPVLNEQRTITSFLDAKCAEIDALVADVQAQIETLEQYKRSVITEAVTKGLNPNVPMKESGIDWIAGIPEHWESVPFQYVLIERNERNSPAKSDERLSLSIGLGVTLYADKTTNLDRFKEDVSQYKLAYPGDLVMNSMNMIVGATGISKYFGCVSPAYYTFYDNTADHVIAKYCEYLFLTPLVMGELHKLGKGIMFIERGDGRVNTCRLKVSRYDLGHIKIPIPDVEEIRSIVSTLDTKCAEIDAIIDGKRQQLAVLEEYKKSIIFEYVTGKKEVPVA